MKNKVWVLDTETKGTGAQMVPLEKLLRKSAGDASPAPIVQEKRRSRPTEAPEPRQPRKFRVVDVMTQQVLAEGADARVTLDLLKDVRSIVDVSIYFWAPKAERWQMLTHREKKLLFESRHR